jgi:hypothetical protein
MVRRKTDLDLRKVRYFMAEFARLAGQHPVTA